MRQSLTSAIVAFYVALAAGPPVGYLVRRLRMIDTPNDRSSHERPTPRGGGLALIAGALFAAVLVPSFGGHTRVGLLVAAVGFGVIGMVDDLRGVDAVPRIALQVVIASFSLVWLLQDLRGPLAWQVVFNIGCLVWLVAYTNAFNFMDGINGISATQALVAGGTFALIGHDRDLPVLMGGGALVAAAALGFLPSNFPRAKVFLGDVGSYFVGGWLAVLAVVGLRAGVPPEAVLAPLALYLADTATTIVQRARAGDRLFRAHRKHAYQRLTQLGWSHATVTASVATVMVACSVLGSVSLTGSLATRILADLGLVALLVAYLKSPRMFAARESKPVPVVVQARL